MVKIEIDEFHRHEVLDRAGGLADLFNYRILEHPFVASDRTLQVLAEQLDELLHDFYQRVGRRIDEIEGRGV